MATRPLQMLELQLRYTFKTGCNAAVIAGDEVKFGSTDDDLVKTSGADADAIGIVEVAQATVGRPVRVLLYGTGIVPVLVGTGDATRGKLAVRVASGFTNAAANGGGTTSMSIKGRFMQSGVALDMVGMLINPHYGVST